jgi:2-dehydro-3-deoxyglucarate aldolase
MSNSIREALECGNVMYGARVRTFSTTVIQILRETNIDYAYLDIEHAGFSPYDTSKIEDRLRAAEAADLSLIVRIPSAEPSMVRSVLDGGVRTVLMPRVKRASEVEHAIRASRFQYDGGPGERGFGTSPSNNWGNRPDDYTQKEDEQVCIGIMLETKQALENVSEIVSTPELGFAKIGTGDLAVSLDCPQQYEHPTVQNAVETFRKECQRNNVPMGIGTSGVTAAKEAVDDGYRLVEIGGDAEIIQSVINQRLSQL